MTDPAQIARHAWQAERPLGRYTGLVRCQHCKTLALPSRLDEQCLSLAHLTAAQEKKDG